MAEHRTGTIFVKQSHRALGRFQYRLWRDQVTVWTIPGTSDHIGFLKAHNENQEFTLLLVEGNRLIDLVVTNVKPDGDRFEVMARVVSDHDLLSGADA